jgi:hypothetical protein
MKGPFRWLLRGIGSHGLAVSVLDGSASTTYAAMGYGGFMVGDLVHGRLGEIDGLRLWMPLGALLTTACNWLASLRISAVTLAILSGIGIFFVKA